MLYHRLWKVPGRIGKDQKGVERVRLGWRRSGKGDELYKELEREMEWVVRSMEGWRESRRGGEGQ